MYKIFVTKVKQYTTHSPPPTLINDDYQIDDFSIDPRYPIVYHPGVGFVVGWLVVVAKVGETLEEEKN